ncbi:MAG: hypothetical protein V3V22_01630 [Methylococcales bacterium]
MKKFVNKTKTVFLLLILLFGVCQSAWSLTLQSGWWWNADESGTGYTIEQQDDKIFFAAYLYNDDGSAVWYTALMKETTENQFTGDLEEYQKGQSLTGKYLVPELADIPGQVFLEFSSESEGTLTLLNSSIPISRFKFRGGCTEVTKPETGWWWNQDRSGRGYAIERQGNQLFFAAYLYDDAGAAVWHTAAMNREADGKFVGELEEFKNGQSLASKYKKPELAAVSGTISLEFSSETEGILTVLDSTIPLTRFRF